jgi:NADH-quinone oxidoreductase subunit M
MAGTMLLSAIMLKMALFGMIKWMIPLTVEIKELTAWIIMVLSVIGIIYGAVIAIKQNDIKIIFAYASLSHLGIICGGIAVFTKEALFGASLQMLNHSLLSVGMFLVADILEQRTKSKNIQEMGGIAKLAPSFGFWFAVVALASVSVPFSAGFIGEFILIFEIFNFNLWTGILAATTLVFGAVLMLRAFQLSMFGYPKMESFKDLRINELLVFLIISAFVLLLGICPQLVKDFIDPCLEKIVNSTLIKVE